MYNKYMTRNHFSKYGGPYFMNDGFSGHPENHARNKKKVSLLARIKAFFSFRSSK